ncbi:MAG: peptidoglycan-binding domain-containing protein [Alphaproteobacteria bacterium]
MAWLAVHAPAAAQSVPEILAVQERLIELGYDPGPADGLAGSMTRNAIAEFQRDVGLEETGKITLTLLNVLGANPNAPQPLADVQARLVDIIGARWDETAEPSGPTVWMPPPAEAIPAFADYPAVEAPDALVESVDFTSHPDAALFEAALRQAIGKPADFAARYRIAQVGCGTTCQAVIAVDATSGRVVPGPTAEFGFDYRDDSRLLVANPTDAVTAAFGDDIPLWAATRWFVFDGTEFLTLTPVAGEPGVLPDATAETGGDG